MSAPVRDRLPNDGTKLGEHAAMQPVSGVRDVAETFAVNGTGRGGFVRREDTPKTAKPS